MPMIPQPFLPFVLFQQRLECVRLLLIHHRNPPKFRFLCCCCCFRRGCCHCHRLKLKCNLPTTNQFIAFGFLKRCKVLTWFGFHQLACHILVRVVFNSSTDFDGRFILGIILFFVIFLVFVVAVSDRTNSCTQTQSNII